MGMRNLKDLIRDSKKLYPNSKHLQHQWVSKTAVLLATGKHALQTGGWCRMTNGA